jgi:hypothetical protein
MNSNAYAFFKVARDKYSLIRNFRFEAEDGYLKMNDSPFLPIYLVPNKRESWSELAALLTELVVDYVNQDWLTTVTMEFKVPESFTSRWCKLLRESSHHGSFSKDGAPSMVEQMESENSDAASGGG